MQMLSFSFKSLFLTATGVLWGFPLPTQSFVDLFSTLAQVSSGTGAVPAGFLGVCVLEPSPGTELMSGFPLAPALAIQSIASVLWNLTDRKCLH